MSCRREESEEQRYKALGSEETVGPHSRLGPVQMRQPNAKSIIKCLVQGVR